MLLMGEVPWVEKDPRPASSTYIRSTSTASDPTPRMGDTPMLVPPRVDGHGYRTLQEDCLTATVGRASKMIPRNLHRAICWHQARSAVGLDLQEQRSPVLSYLGIGRQRRYPTSDANCCLPMGCSAAFQKSITWWR